MSYIKPVGNAVKIWQGWMDVNCDNRHPKGQIVYEMRIIDHNRNPVTIGKDPIGMIYIGETKTPKNGKSRYRLLVNSFKNPVRKNKHSAANDFFQRYQNQYPNVILQSRYKIVARESEEVACGLTHAKGKDMATTSERSELSSYENRYETLPLLNSIHGKKSNVTHYESSPKSAGKHIKMGKDPYSVLQEI